MPRSERDLALDTLVTSNRLVRMVARTSNPGETPSQWRALALLAEQGPIRLTTFAKLDRLSQPTATVTLSRLEAKGLVSRTPDPSDGRASLFDLTDAGREHLEELRTRATATLAEPIEKLDPSQRAALNTAIDALRSIVDDEHDR